MAIITIFIEGGVLEHENTSVQTLDNSQRLRESFYKLLTQKIDSEMFSLVVEVGSSVNQTVKFLKTAITKEKETLAIIDLDAPVSEKEKRILELGLSGENERNNIVFMVQEMEAWIVSQPDKIESYCKSLTRVKPNVKFLEDSILKDKHPESISKPSDKLKTLLGRYYRVEKRGKLSKKKYNKLKDGAGLLEILDYSKLEKVFSDVQFLSDKLKHK